ncbi:MAG: hypothetical protein N3B01_03255 [Verrucomicrobiae bacterium]|nr:hypothetical protein [Verrucomicrobiae bacterium]
MIGHWFWALLTVAALVWYGTVTVYVAVRGVRDIQQMLRNLGRQRIPTVPPSDS